MIDDRFSQASDVDTAMTLLRFKNGVLGFTETSRRSNWGYDIRTEVAGAIGKVVVEAPQKTPLLFAAISHPRTITSRTFQIALKRPINFSCKAFFKICQEAKRPSPGPEDALETLRLAVAVTKAGRKGGRSKFRRSNERAFRFNESGTADTF